MILQPILFKERDDDGKYDELNDSVNDSLYINVLEFELLDAIEPFEQQNTFNAIILTSKRAIPFIKKYKLTGCLKYFVVGKSIEDILINDLQIAKERIIGAESGNALALCEIILQKENCKYDFLFLSGNKRKDTVMDELIQNNVSIKEIVVYKTKLRNSKDILQDYLNLNIKEDEIMKVFVFFSPSGYNAVMDLNILENSLIVAIGKTTAKNIKNCNQICIEPSPKGLKLAIQELL